MAKKGINGAYVAAYNQYPWGAYNLSQSLLLAAIMAIVALYALKCGSPGCGVVAAIMVVGVALCLRNGVEAGVGWILWQRNGQVTVGEDGLVFRTGGHREIDILWQNITAVRWRRQSPYFRLRNADRYDIFQYTLSITFADERGHLQIRDIMQCFANTPHTNCVLVRDVTVRRAHLIEKNVAVPPARSWWQNVAHRLNGLAEERMWIRRTGISQMNGGNRDE